MSTRRERAEVPTARLNSQLAAQQDAARRLEKLSRKNLHTAEIYIDIAKLVLGGVVIGNLFAEKENINPADSQSEEATVLSVF